VAVVPDLFPERPPVFCFPEEAAVSVFFPEVLLVAFFTDDGVLVGDGFDTVELLLFDFLVMVWLCAHAVAMENSIMHISNKHFFISN
jgi:hypothetical protein